MQGRLDGLGFSCSLRTGLGAVRFICLWIRYMIETAAISLGSYLGLDDSRASLMLVLYML